MKAREFDKKFDAGDDVTPHLDLAAARRPLQEVRRVNVDFPSWMIDSLDREARRLAAVDHQDVTSSCLIGSMRPASRRVRVL